MSVVLDSSAMLALLYKEDGAVEVAAELASGSCYAHAVNLCEVFYDFMRTYDDPRAQQAVVDLGAMGVRCRRDLDDEFWQAAGRLKATYKRVSLADCFCAVLASRLGFELITSDRHEMEPLASAGVCRVRFIR